MAKNNTTNTPPSENAGELKIRLLRAALAQEEEREAEEQALQDEGRFIPVAPPIYVSGSEQTTTTPVSTQPTTQTTTQTTTPATTEAKADVSTSETPAVSASEPVAKVEEQKVATTTENTATAPTTNKVPAKPTVNTIDDKEIEEQFKQEEKAEEEQLDKDIEGVKESLLNDITGIELRNEADAKNKEGEKEFYKQVEEDLNKEQEINDKALDEQISKENEEYEKKLNEDLTNSIAKDIELIDEKVGRMNVTAPYSQGIYDLSNQIKDWEEKKKAKQAEDATAKKRANSMKMIAGISDGLAALANLIGVSKGGTNIDMGTGALTPLAQNLEKARLERKADIKDIDAKLEQYANQLADLKMKKGVALSGYEQKRQERKDTIEAASKKAALEQWKHLQTLNANAQEAAMKEAGLNARHAAEMEVKEKGLNIDAAKVAAIVGRNQQIAQDKINKNMKEFTFNEGGEDVVYQVPKETLEDILRDFSSVIEQDIANDETGKTPGSEFSQFRKAYNRYKSLIDQEKADLSVDNTVLRNAFNALVQYSPTIQERIRTKGKRKGNGGASGAGDKWSEYE